METGSFSIQMIYLAIFIAMLPMFSFLVLTFLKKALSQKLATLAASTLQGIALLGTIWLMFKVLQTNEPLQSSLDWFRISTNIFSLRFYIDRVTAIMFFIVNLISFLVHIFSLEYMKEDQQKIKYFAYLDLFTFSMLGILLTANLIAIYVFWELVGLSSYLLIGFWHEKQKARQAAKKAFILNRIGDAGFLIGIITLYLVFATLDLKSIEISWLQAIENNYHLLLLAGFGIFCGAIGKSAQLPLSSWLPDAMEGPTPVSALIHAATMVAAGVYLLFRCSFLFLPEIDLVIASVGITTAFVAALTALSQTDIKKVLAYSTVSQLGYMVAAIGVGAAESGMFHLFTHAFFKAGLFLSAGAVIHAIHQSAHKSNVHIDAQDMRFMGGMYKKMPLVAICFALCASALAGLPLFSGFLSKDAILLGMWQFAAQEAGTYLYWLIPTLGFATALITAYYSARQVFLVFGGKNGWRGNTKIWEYLPELNLQIKWPLIILAAFSLFVGFSLNPFDAQKSWISTSSFNLDHGQSTGHSTVIILSASLATLGIFSGWMVYQTESWSLRQLISKKSFVYQFTNRFWFIDDALVDPAKRLLLSASNGLAKADNKIIDTAIDGFAILQVVLAHVLAWFDKNIVDGFIGLLTSFTHFIGNIIRKSPGKQVQSYVSWAVLTTLLIVIIAVLYLEM